MALHDLDAAISDREDRPAWLERHRMTADDYQASLEQLGAEGYRLRHVSGYAVDGQDLYAAVWDRTDGPDWQARHRLTADEYQATSDRLAADGYRLSCVSAYAVDDQDLYAAIWEQKDGPAWQAHHRLDGAGLEQMSETLARDGFRPVLITACPVDGRDLYAGLWQQGAAPETVAQHTISDQPEAEGFQRRELAGSFH